MTPGGIIGAYIAANYANSVSEQKLAKIIGLTFIILGIISFFH